MFFGTVAYGGSAPVARAQQDQAEFHARHSRSKRLEQLRLRNPITSITFRYRRALSPARPSKTLASHSCDISVSRTHFRGTRIRSEKPCPFSRTVKL